MTERLNRRPHKSTEKSRPQAKRPTADDFKPESVQRAVRDQALQHPLTIFPAAAAAVAGLATILFQAPQPALATVGLGVLSCGMFIYNWLIRGADRAEEHVAKLRELRERYKALEIESLIEECERTGYEEGLQESRQLNTAYETLLANLQRSGQPANSMAITRFKALAEDSLHEGVSCLRKALRLHQTLATFDLAEHERELAGWRQNLEGLAADSSEAVALQGNINTSPGGSISTT